ncbi:MAG: hypothetical protein WCG00_11210 [Hyphomicrobiales bacterium]
MGNRMQPATIRSKHSSGVFPGVSRQIREVKELLAARRFEREIFDLKYGLAALRFQVAALRFGHVCQKAGFKEDQPRWPEGSGDNSGRWSGGAGSGVTVSTSTGFLTGISTIDNTSKALSETLVRVMQNLNFIPESSPQAYGIAVHVAFASAVRLQNLPGIGSQNVERSFSLEDNDPHYGLAGSIRTDVALQNDQGEVIAIYDVKTGESPLSRSRANELREKTRAAPNTPVFELNVVCGPSMKCRQTGMVTVQRYLELAGWRF